MYMEYMWIQIWNNQIFVQKFESFHYKKNMKYKSFIMTRGSQEPVSFTWL